MCIKEIGYFVGNVTRVVVVNAVINPITAIFYVMTDSCANRYDSEARKLLDGNIRVLKGIPKRQQYRVAYFAHSLLSDPAVSQKLKKNLFNGLGRIAPANRESVIHQCRSIIDSMLYREFEELVSGHFVSISGNFHLDLIAEIMKIPTNYRRPVLENCLDSLFKSILDRNKVAIIKLIAPPTHAEERNQILEVIEDIPPNELEDILENAMPLLEGIPPNRGIGQSSQKAYTIKAIASVPFGDRKNVLQHANLFTEGIKGDFLYKANVIKAIASVPFEDRETVLIHVNSFIFFQEIKNLYHITDIIKAVASIPFEKRRDFLLCFRENFECEREYVKISVLKVVATVPFEGGLFMQKIKRLFEDADDDHSKLEIIRTIELTPSENRVNGLERAMPGRPQHANSLRQISDRSFEMKHNGD